MKKPLQASNQTPAWQTEHAKKRHRACLRIQRLVSAGMPIQRAICRVASSLNASKFRCDPARRMALSVPTLRRVWDKWQRGGKVPDAVTLKFNPRRQVIPVWVLVLFAKFCGNQPLRSLAGAWRIFCARRLRAGHKLNFSDFVVRRHFPVARFYLIQVQLKASRKAQAELQQTTISTIAALRAGRALMP